MPSASTVIVLLDSLEELCQTAQAFLKAGALTGPRLGVISPSGGTGCLVADAATAHSKDEATGIVPLPAWAVDRTSSSTVARLCQGCASRRTNNSPEVPGATSTPSSPTIRYSIPDDARPMQRLPT